MVRINKSSLILFLAFSFIVGGFFIFSCSSKVNRNSSTNKDIKLILIEKGYYGGIKDNEMSFYVFDNQTDLDNFHKRIHSNEITPPKNKNIDFSKNIVIAAVYGEQPTGGYSIDIEDASFSNNKLTVRIITKKPKQGQFLTQAFSNPYVIYSISREDKEIKEIHFIDQSGKLLKTILLK